MLSWFEHDFFITSGLFLSMLTADSTKKASLKIAIRQPLEMKPEQLNLCQLKLDGRRKKQNFKSVKN